MQLRDRDRTPAGVAVLALLAGSLFPGLCLWGLSLLLVQAVEERPILDENTRIEISLVDPEVSEASEFAQNIADLEDVPVPLPDEPERPDVPLPKPEPLPELEKEPEAEKEPEPQVVPPPPVEVPKRDMKMVEQLDSEETPPPVDADYLSNIDRSVLEQTRAEITNLKEDAAQAKATEKNPQRDTNKKAPDAETELAQLEDRPAADAKKAKTTNTNSADSDRPSLSGPTKPSLLTMRSPRATDKGTDRPTPTASETERVVQNHQGELMRHQERSPAQRGGAEAPRRRLNLAGSTAAMERSIGHDAVAQAAVERSRRSRTAGVWDKARERYQSPLENMVPEVRTGNQTALNSRAHPFARYIATIHRSIHDVWGDGFLRQWDALPGSSAFNDFSLWTRVEMVLLADGTVEGVKTVHRSGNSSFDAVARDTVFEAGPYPPAPPEIRSGNGKVYIHWAFHRNAYACGTFGAEPFILNNSGQGDRPDPHREINLDGVAHEGHTHRRLERNGLGAQPSVTYGPKAPPNRASSAVQAPKKEPPKLPPTATQHHSLVKSAANAWVLLLTRGEGDSATRVSALPFQIGQTQKLQKRETLKNALEVFSSELRDMNIERVEVVNAAGLMRRFGTMPGDWQPSDRVQYAFVQLSSDRFVLRLELRAGVWVVSGLAR